MEVIPRAPGLRHRRQGSTGAGRRRRGVCAAEGSEPGGRPAREGCAVEEEAERSGVGGGSAGCGRGTCGPGRDGTGLVVRGCRLRIVASGASAPGCRLRAVGSGRPRNRRPWMTGPLSPAARSHTLRCGPTTHLQYVTRLSEATRGFLFSNRPPLADTDAWTNEGLPGPVTRRTGESGPELRYGLSPAGTGPRWPQARRRPQIRRTTSNPPGGLRSAPGTVQGRSSRVPCPACRAPGCSGPGPPSHGRGSPGARRMSSGRPG